MRLRLDIYRHAGSDGRRRAAAGRDPGPRRRLVRRLPLRAGHPAAQPPRRARLDRLQHRLPAQPARRRCRTRSSTSSGRSPGSASNAGELGIDPGRDLHHRRLRRRAPDRARGADRERPRLPARLRGRRHLARGRGPLLRRLRPDQRERPLLPGAAGAGCSSRSSSSAAGRRRGAVPRRLAALPRPRRRAPVHGHPRRARHARPGRRRARLRRASWPRLGQRRPLHRAARRRARLRPLALGPDRADRRGDRPLPDRVTARLAPTLPRNRRQRRRARDRWSRLPEALQRTDKAPTEPCAEAATRHTRRTHRYGPPNRSSSTRSAPPAARARSTARCTRPSPSTSSSA